ncbi:beta-propeller fold lactonase family protein [Aetokthonos hydrillicola Thurmond2011]|jgi:YVTN family beta-propeller protein|uniref:Beta-propeller fold lactonase family protein n=2 Tax=Aetokthonos TaxID=1550243 RepID=A0AAP5I707_9CYAN|nr:beta-propeller fold lactonase family protein [Aetokthonos hydrillicola]MBW4586754.1 beta-propeller fold lactonase family protein [Aetokthonos hydrillicola CCALA 1050]MDR9895889.1 beta-propeller fold lactonase family protein [Aetokthonos hydrillicola Thurmond2011]
MYKKCVHLLSIAVLATLGMNIPSASARTTKPVGDIGNGAVLLPTGQVITPAAAPGSIFAPLKTNLRQDENADAAEAVTTALSPDGKTLLVLTSGYNQNFKTETGQDITQQVLDPTTGQPSNVQTKQSEWVFVFDVSSGNLIRKQQIGIPNTYDGITWAPDGKGFYVSAGIDDRIYVYKFDGTKYVPDAPFILLGHNSNQTAPFPKYDGGLLKNTPAGQKQPALVTGAVVAGVAVSRDGKTLVAANFENDSISIVDTSGRKVLQEIKFFEPGSQQATGEFPYDVALKSDRNTGAATTAYVTSQRDNEVLAVDIATKTVTRIAVGSQPNKVLLSRDQSLLYVANGNSDSVSVINTNNNKVVETISLSRPGDKYKGANANSLALSPDSKTLYVTLGGENAVAVVDLKTERVQRIPTGWYPNSVSVSQDGTKLYVVNAKSASGPNPANSRTTPAGSATNTTFKNPYNWALEKAGISVIPVPNRSTLAALSKQVDENNGFQNRRPDPVMSFLRNKIKHVVYIVKENRTYDQVLGDLSVGNGDPSLTLLPQAVSPNHHDLALKFGVLDNFYDSGESSGVGWSWSTFGRTTDYTEKSQSVLYGNANFNGLTYDYEGTNRNINPALPQTSSQSNQINTRITGVLDPSGRSSILPGSRDVNAPEGADETQENVIGGYLWDAALRAGKSVRNYGFFVDQIYYDLSANSTDATKPDPNNPYYIPISATPFKDKIAQAPVAKGALQDRTDLYFRSYDQKNSDIYLFNEWQRDFAQNGMPNLMLVRFAHDHFGSFDTAVLGLNTPELQMADNDYAVGLFVQAVSQTREWKDGSVAIFIIEDDSQNGPDHVDSHRSIGYVISPYTRRNSPTVISTNYNTVSMLRTMEDLLGIGYLGITDANAEPMSDLFTQTPDTSPYTAIVPGNLCSLPQDPNRTLVPACNSASVPKTRAIALRHRGSWWADMTKNFNFKVEDKVDPDEFNEILWAGIKGDSVPYPKERSRADLRRNRAQLLKRWQLSQKTSSTEAKR